MEIKLERMTAHSLALAKELFGNPIGDWKFGDFGWVNASYAFDPLIVRSKAYAIRRCLEVVLVEDLLIMSAIADAALNGAEVYVVNPISEWESSYEDK